MVVYRRVLRFVVVRKSAGSALLLILKERAVLNTKLVIELQSGLYYCPR